jgi:hypothetical protein
MEGFQSLPKMGRNQEIIKLRKVVSKSYMFDPMSTVMCNKEHSTFSVPFITAFVDFLGLALILSRITCIPSVYTMDISLYLLTDMWTVIMVRNKSTN